MGAIKKGQTPGKVRNVLGVTRMYYKPALGKFILRKPGVIRTSDKVLARNEKVRASPPAKACKGLHFYDGTFQACLAKNMPR
jgi:hypothetical protein